MHARFDIGLSLLRARVNLEMETNHSWIQAAFLINMVFLFSEFTGGAIAKSF
jgi:hypothetical protein